MEKKPSLALIPSAYKEGKVYSVLPADGVGDFNFSRATTATRINKDGLIETVGSNIPRLNYPMIDGVVSGCPSLLLEPSRSNDLQRSQEFDNNYWTKYQTSVLANSSISLDGGLNADRLIEDNSNSTHQLGRAISYTIGTTYTVSIFAKSSDRNLEVSAGNTNTFPVKAVFDLKNGIVLSETFGSAAIQKFNNGWYRCVITASALATSTTNINFGLANGSTLSYNGNGVSFIELFGAMREQGSYPTSYIPTSGSIGTRDAEVCNGAGNEQVFNDNEGVLFAEISALANDQTNRLISLTNGTSSERISLFYSQDFSNEIKGIVFDGGVATAQLSFISNDITDTSKIALKYKQNDFALWVNGIEVVSEDNGTVPSGLNKLAFDLGISSTVLPFYGNIKDVRVYSTALTDTDLEELTSWRSFNEMARDLLYTIE